MLHACGAHKLEVGGMTLKHSNDEMAGNLCFWEQYEPFHSCFKGMQKKLIKQNVWSKRLHFK